MFLFLFLIFYLGSPIAQKLKTVQNFREITEKGYLVIIVNSNDIFNSYFS